MPLCIDENPAWILHNLLDLLEEGHSLVGSERGAGTHVQVSGAHTEAG